MHDLSSIQDAAILRGLDPDELQQLSSIASPLEVRKGERIFARGQATGSLFVARTGRYVLTVALRVLDGESELPIEELKPFDAFGWSALVEPHASIYSSWCTEGGEVVAFPGKELAERMAANPALGLVLSGNLNVLIGNRVRVLQKLWLEEVEQHMDRIRHWTRTEASRTWRHGDRKFRQGFRHTSEYGS